MLHFKLYDKHALHVAVSLGLKASTLGQLLSKNGLNSAAGNITEKIRNFNDQNFRCNSF